MSAVSVFQMCGCWMNHRLQSVQRSVDMNQYNWVHAEHRGLAYTVWQHMTFPDVMPI